MFLGAIFALSYFGAVELGRLLYFTENVAASDKVVSPFWPASGVFVAALLMFRYRFWPVLLALSLLAQPLAGLLMHQGTLLREGAFWLSNALEATGVAFLLRRLLGESVDLSRLRGALLLTVTSAVFAGAALIGAGVYAHLEGAEFARVWQVWWLGDFLGVLTVGATLLAWFTPRAMEDTGPSARAIEWVLVLAMTVVVARFVYRGTADFHDSILSLPTIVFPVLIWAAMRLRTRGASTVALTITLSAMWNSASGRGPFAAGRLAFEDSVLWLQSGLVIAAITGLMLAAVVTQRDRRTAELARQQAELAHADKLISLGTLVSSVAHEIDNPNQLILLNLPTLEAVWRDTRPVLDARQAEEVDLRVAGVGYGKIRDEIDKLLRDVRGGAERIKGIVGELRAYARADGAREAAEFDVNESVRSAVSLLGNRLKKSTRSFRADLAPGLPRVSGHPRRLEQVVVNLLLNACQALTDRVQAIAVRTRSEAGRVAIEVRDQGKGILPQDLARVRDPFFTTKEEGTGLGLAVATRIVEEHGGQLELASEPGKGTTARVSLPAHHAESP